VGSDESDFHDSVVVIDLNDQTVLVAYDLESCAASWNHLRVGKVGKNVGSFFSDSPIDGGFPSGETLSGISVLLCKLVQLAGLQNNHPDNFGFRISTPAWPFSCEV